MASGWFGGRAIELVRARSLFVKVFPTPASLTERRAVLHALNRYGQMEVFKRLPNPETFICAPTRTEVAAELVSRSPLTFKFVSETLESIQAKSLPGVGPLGVASPIQIHEDNSNSNGTNTKLPNLGEEAQSDVVKTFTLYIHPSQNYYEHKTNIRLTPIHGPWPKIPELDLDFVYFALKEVVPKDIAQAGLCDWHTGLQLSDEPAAIRAQHEHSKLWHIRERQLRRKKSKAIEGDADSTLVALKSLQTSSQPTQPTNQDGLDGLNGLDSSALGNLEDMKSRDQSEQTVSDPFLEMERQAQRESDGKQTKPTRSHKMPAWVRRKHLKLNPLADGKHSKLDKKNPIPDARSAGKWFEFKSIYNGQMDNVKLPGAHLEDKR